MATAPAPTNNTVGTEVAVEEPTVLNFDDAFKDFVKDETGVSASQTDAKPAPAAAAAEEPPTEIVEPAEGEEEPAPEHVPEDKNSDEALTRLADMLAARQQPVQQPREEPRQQPQSVYTPEQQGIVEKFYEDFPDVAAAAAIERAAEYKLLTNHIFSQIGSYLAPQLALLNQLADRTVYTDLTTQVTDYDTVRDKVIDWVKTQPAYLQPAYNNVIQRGTVDEISDLFDRYRAATGATAPTGGIAPAAGGRAPVAPKAQELSPAARQAAERLAPVQSKRSAPTQQTPLDFESAFDTFAKAG